MPMPRTQPITKNCVVCGREFQVCPPGRSSQYFPRNTQRMCSIACQQAGRYRHGRICNQLTVADAAYVAGFLDGEGSILLYKRNPTALRVCFANTNLDVLDWLRTTCGAGHITSHRGTDKHKAGHLYLLNSDPACYLLEQIRPYLRIKATQADLAIEFQHRIRIPELKADHAWQLEAREHMMQLNRRGPNLPLGT